MAGQLCEPRIGEAHRLELPQELRTLREPVLLDPRFPVHDLLDLAQEPRVDAAGLVDEVHVEAETESLRNLDQPVRPWRREGSADCVLVVPEAEAGDLD